MTASILQGGSAGSAASVPSLALSLTGLTAGSTVEVFAGLNHFYGITSVVGSVNGAYALTDSAADDGSTAKLLVYRKTNVAVGAETVTITYDASRANVAAAWVEAGGVKTASFDVTATGRSQAAPGTSTDATASNAATNTVQPALIIGASWDLTGNAPAAGTGFTSALLADFAALGSSGQLRVEYKRITTTTSVTATFTATVGANTHLNVMNILDEAVVTSNYVNLERQSNRGVNRGVR
jgi:hypothetical protein